MLALLAVMWIVRGRSRARVRTLLVMAAATPLILAAVCLGWYNWARFGSVTQTGQIYQLTGFMDLRRHQDQFLSPLYAPQNAHNYLLNPPAGGPDFPYLHVKPVRTEPILGANLLPELYGGQQITGFLYTVPFVALAWLPITKRRGPWARREAGDLPDAHDDGRLWRWTVLGLSAACAATFASLLIYFWSAMRFLADFMPLLMLLSSLGFWMGYEELRSSRTARRLYVVLGSVLAGISIINSTLIAISINHARFAISEWLAGGL